MVQQTPRGLPVPESTDPDNVPYFIGQLASFLDPGALAAFNPTAANLGYRIAFILEGDGNPNTNAVPVAKGSIYFDRQSARIWLPLTQLVDTVSTLAWSRLGADVDAELANLDAGMIGMVRTGDQTDAVTVAGQVTVACAGNPGTDYPGFLGSVVFPEAFTSTVASVQLTNGDSSTAANVILGVQNLSVAGFDVLVSRPTGDTPFHTGDRVVINYFALGS